MWMIYFRALAFTTLLTAAQKISPETERQAVFRLVKCETQHP